MPGRVVRERALSFGDELAEPVGVAGSRCDREDVPVLPGRDRVVAERAAKLRDVGLQRLERRPRLSLTPELVEQPVGRDDLVPMQEQQREQGARLPDARESEPVAISHLKRAEDPKLHTHLLPRLDPI
jgi:hypothetical protein